MIDSITSLNIDYLNELLKKDKMDEIYVILENCTPENNVTYEPFLLNYLELCLEVNSQNNKFYKNNNMYVYLECICKHLFVQDLSSSTFNSIIHNINNSMYGQKILYKIDTTLFTKYTLNFLEIISFSVRYSTLPTLVFWINKYKEINSENFIDLFKYTEEEPEKLTKYETYFIHFVCASLMNNDDRIFKYVFSDLNIGKNHLTLLNKHLEDIIKSIFNYGKPDKYKLKRVKELSKYCKLEEKSNLILNNFNGSLSTFKKLYKFYFKDNSYITYDIKSYKYYPFCYVSLLKNITFLIDQEDFSTIFTDYCQSIYDFLKTKLEKNLFLISILYFDISFTIANNLNDIIKEDWFHCIDTFLKNYHYLDDKETDTIINSNISYIVDKLAEVNNDDVNFNSITFIINFIKNKKEIINKFNFTTNTRIYYSKKLFFAMLPFMNYGQENIRINKMLFLLKIFIKTKKKQFKNMKEFKIKPILNEIKNLKPNNIKPVFKRETYNYKLKKQKFNFIPPYSVYPNQIQNMNFKCYLKEKTDGELINKIHSKNLYPLIYFSESIKAEYVEDLDLYLIFDIDLDMPIDDRYHYLRRLHPNTKNFINNGVNIEEKINNERDNLTKFLSEDYESYRWYPKAAFECDTNDIEFKQLMIDVINNKNNRLHTWLCNNEVENDGFIITPLNGDREIKVKPKSLLTIDLLYDNNNWYDRDGYNYNDMIENEEKVEYQNNTIYRLYPSNEKYIPKEIRTDKSKPNPRDVVNALINFQKIDFNLNKEKEIYFNNKVYQYNIQWKNIIQNNKDIVSKMLKNHREDTNWLDLGCGNGKNIKFIGKYDNYYGIDYDLNQLVIGINRYLNKKNVFNYLDLSKEWNSTSNKWLDIDFTVKFDNIMAINSLMHFCNDTFWKQLDKLTTCKTKFTFNLINNKLDEKFSFGNSYIYKEDDKIKYYFEPVHNDEMCENYVSKDKLETYLEKYGWKIIEEYTPTYGTLNDYYTWYTVIKN